MINKNNEKIKKILILIGIFILSILLSILTVSLNKKSFISSEFLINYMGVFLGICLTLITFIHSNIRDIKNKNVSSSKIFEELKDDTYLIFWMFVISFGIYAIEKIDFPFVLLGANYIFKIMVIDVFRNIFLFTSLYSMFDIIGCMFVLIFEE